MNAARKNYFHELAETETPPPFEPRPNVAPTLLGSLDLPSDLKTLSIDDLNALTKEIRSVICNLSERRSVHFASNLGVVELAIALHSVFDFRRDRLVWDVGHQCYPHKLLTGRFAQFDGIRTRDGLSGYPNPQESDFDLFMTGHAGCSVGSALGLACGDALAERFAQQDAAENAAQIAVKNDNSDKTDAPIADSLNSNSRYSIAVVGDGALASGPIFEALNHAGGLRQKMLVVLNDNKMSICKRVGGLGQYLDKARVAPCYLGVKKNVRRVVENFPTAYKFLQRLKDAAKAGLLGGMLFEDFGFQYVGPIDGHDLATLRRYLESIKTFDEPVLLHVLTEKGRGYRPAEIDPSHFHAPSPAAVLNGESKLLFDELRAPELATTAEKSETAAVERAAAINNNDKIRETADPDAFVRIDFAETETNEPQAFTYWASSAIIDAMRRDRRVCVVVAAMTQGNLLEQARAEFPDRFFDVGICEAHAVNFAAGLAKSGMRPIVDIYSGFLQRAYDHIFQEASLQNLPIVFALDRAGLVGADGPTHHGVFDLSYLRPFPNMTVVAPGDATDAGRAFDFALGLDGPVAIRYPKTKTARLPRDGSPFELGRAETLRDGVDATFVVCGGGILQTAFELAQDLASGEVPGVPALDVGVVDARFVKPLDRETVLRSLRERRPTVCVEENALDGGFGAAVLEAANDEGLDARFLLRKGVPDRYIRHGSRDEELKDAGLDRDGLLNALLTIQKRADALKNQD